jgi:hypothetical protein
VLYRILRALFPVERVLSPDKYAQAHLDGPAQQATIKALNDAAGAVTDEARLKEFKDIAEAKRSSEDARQASVISRAQALFVALALFGFLFTFGANLFSSSTGFSKPMLGVSLAVVSYIIAQMVIMVSNILRAIGAVGDPSAGSSDLASWLGVGDNSDAYRQLALLTLSFYRRAALNNNWRFIHLDNALRCLRNIVFALGVLILLLFLFDLILPVHSPKLPDLTGI